MRSHKDIHLSLREIKMLMRLKKQKFERLQTFGRDENYNELEIEGFVAFAKWTSVSNQSVIRGYMITSRGKEHLRHFLRRVYWKSLVFAMSFGMLIVGIVAMMM